MSLDSLQSMGSQTRVGGVKGSQEVLEYGSDILLKSMLLQS